MNQDTPFQFLLFAHLLPANNSFTRSTPKQEVIEPQRRIWKTSKVNLPSHPSYCTDLYQVTFALYNLMLGRGRRDSNTQIFDSRSHPILWYTSLQRQTLCQTHTMVSLVFGIQVCVAVSGFAPWKYWHKDFIAIYNIENHSKQEGSNTQGFCTHFTTAQKLHAGSWSFLPSSTSGAAPSQLGQFSTNPHSFPIAVKPKVWFFLSQLQILEHTLWCSGIREPEQRVIAGWLPQVPNPGR